jgi:hypothetical protein
MENTYSPQEELAYIRKIITDSRASFVEDGKPYIWWGIIVAVGMTLTYISVLTQTELYVGYVWIGLTMIGWGSIIYHVREKKKMVARSKSFIDRIQGAIWGACGAAIGISVFLIILSSNWNPGNVPPIHQYYICFVTSMIVGIAYLLSGIANDLKWLSNVGYAWWVGAAYMIIVPSVHNLLIYALMIVFFQVVPGIILMKRYKRMTSTPALG